VRGRSYLLTTGGCSCAILRTRNRGVRPAIFAIRGKTKTGVRPDPQLSVQHDNTNYAASFVAGRANLSSATRYDVTNTSQFTVSTMQYNTAGAVVVTHDPLNHGVTVSYADSFSDGIGRNTLAYPTTVTDPDGYSATSQYNFDFGAVTSKQTPQPNTVANLPGPVQTIAYDSLGRTAQVTNLVNNAYTRFVYPASQNRVDTYATIQDNAGEAHSFKITDGHGRAIASASDHAGSAGGFSGQLIYYDLMGRTVKTSEPNGSASLAALPFAQGPYAFLKICVPAVEVMRAVVPRRLADVIQVISLCRIQGRVD